MEGDAGFAVANVLDQWIPQIQDVLIDTSNHTEVLVDRLTDIRDLLAAYICTSSEPARLAYKRIREERDQQYPDMEVIKMQKK